MKTDDGLSGTRGEAGIKSADVWAIGVDLGGTKVEVARVDREGRVIRRSRRPSRPDTGPASIEKDIAEAVVDLLDQTGEPPFGVAVGVAGQVDPESGAVHFAPNLDWHDVPLRSDLERALSLPVGVINDVRAATWGEWLFGAGRGFSDLVCLFVGTGIGGGVVSGGRILSGCSNTAGELGHMTIDVRGPECRCGNKGCLEAEAGGWAIARSAREAVAADPPAGAFLLERCGGRPESITAMAVAQAAHDGDWLSGIVVDRATEALVAGAVGLVNAFNPCRLILGGGILEGLPELVGKIEAGVRTRALRAATARLEVLPALLGRDSAVIGAAAFAFGSLGRGGER